MRIQQLFYTAIILFFSFAALAQTKVGTVNINIIVSQLPEITQVQAGIQEYEKQLQGDLQSMLNNYNKEFEKASEAFTDMSDEVKKKKQQEILDLESDIKKFRQNAAQLIELKQDELMRPLYNKVGNAVSIIAKEDKYTQVFTLDGNELAYVDPLYDLTLKVAKNLGLKIE